MITTKVIPQINIQSWGEIVELDVRLVSGSLGAGE